MAYSVVSDLLIGDIPLASKYGDGQGMVNNAADEIDAQIGHLYVTPIVLDNEPENRPAKLLLKKINNFLASGRIILDQAAAGEDTALHAYGWSLIREATGLLEKICDGDIKFPGAEEIEGSASQSRGPITVNEDEYSLVEAFYTSWTQPQLVPPILPAPPIVPYDDPLVS